MAAANQNNIQTSVFIDHDNKNSIALMKNMLHNQNSIGIARYFFPGCRALESIDISRVSDCQISRHR